LVLNRATTTGTDTANTAASRNAAATDAVGPRSPTKRLVTSWVSTPDTAIARPDAVERNAAKAPAVTSPVNSSPPNPPIISRGSSSTSTSLCPSAIRSPP
jgi:hypothetical protein